MGMSRLIDRCRLFRCQLNLHSPRKPAIAVVGSSAVLVGIASSPAMLAAQLLLTYAPVMNRLFRAAPMDAGVWLRIAGLAGLALVAFELEKLIRFNDRCEASVTSKASNQPHARRTDLSSLEWG